MERERKKLLFLVLVTEIFHHYCETRRLLSFISIMLVTLDYAGYLQSSGPRRTAYLAITPCNLPPQPWGGFS